MLSQTLKEGLWNKRFTRESLIYKEELSQFLEKLVIESLHLRRLKLKHILKERHIIKEKDT